MPNRRTMELMIVVVVLLTPVLGAARVWASKHIATTSNDATATAAKAARSLI